jgi:hypothetical protein
LSEVNGEPLVTWLCSKVGFAENNERLKKLNMGAVHKKLVSAEAALAKVQVDADDWQAPLNVDAARANIAAQLARYNEAVVDVKRHQNALLQETSKSAESVKAAARIWRANRDKIRVYFEKVSCPSVIAKRAADCLMCRIEDPSKHDIQLGNVVNKVVASAAETESSLFNGTFALGLAPPLDGSDPSHLVAELSEVHMANKNLVRAKAVTMEKHLTEKGVLQGIATVDTARQLKVAPKDVDPKSTTPPWPVCVDTRLIVFCQRNLIVETCLQAWPFRGHPLWLTSVMGVCVVVVLSAEIVSDNKDIKAWLRDAAPSDLRYCHAYFLDRGMSVYCPFGSMPVVLGIPNEANTNSMPKHKKGEFKAGEQDCVTLSVSLAYDKDLLALAPKRHKIVAGTHWIEAKPNFPPSFLKVDGVLEWIKELEADRDGETVHTNVISDGA